MSSNFSDYIVYVDESGDHSLEHINPEYPLFVLAFCIFHKKDYAAKVAPAIQEFKFKFFGHDMIVLHEHEIRKAENEFSILIDKQIRHDFMHELNTLIDKVPFTIISTVIDKRKLREKYASPNNPYHIALQYGLERVYSFIRERQQTLLKTHIIFECRGKKEDNELELEFRRVCAGDGENYYGPLPFDIILADKRTNSCGLQLADLIARPIGRHILNSSQNNRAYSIINKKIYCDAKGKTTGWGLKYFP